MAGNILVRDLLHKLR